MCKSRACPTRPSAFSDPTGKLSLLPPSLPPLSASLAPLTLLVFFFFLFSSLRFVNGVTPGNVGISFNINI